MGLEMFATWIIVGLGTGWFAGFVIKDGQGRLQDVVLGVIGSSAASAALSMLDVSATTSRLSTALVAFAGAAALIVIQRKFWQARG